MKNQINLKLVNFFFLYKIIIKAEEIISGLFCFCASSLHTNKNLFLQ